MSWIGDRRAEFDQWRYDRSEWASARTLDDLADRNRAWLRGELHQTPGHGGRPNEETEQIRDDLDRLNSRGFVTVGSQPGWRGQAYDGQDAEQRAFVEGYTDEATAARIKETAEQATCRDCEPEHPAVTVRSQPVAHMGWRTSSDFEPVTVWGDRVATGTPNAISNSDHHSMWSRWVNGDAHDELDRSERVIAVDNHWGESRTLWNVLDRAWESDEAEAGR